MAPTLKSTQILMKSRPKGFPSQDNFETSSTSISQDLTGADDVLVQLLDLSVGNQTPCRCKKDLC